MELMIADNTVVIGSRDVAPAGTPGWATDGNPGLSIPATQDAAWHDNMITAELINLVTAAGLSTSKTDWTQVFQALFKATVMTDVSVAANTLTYTPLVVVPSAAIGLNFSFAGRIANTNTSTTVNATISGGSAIRIKKFDGTDPAVGDLIANQFYRFAHDGTNLRVMGFLPSDVQATTSTFGRTQIFTASGTFTWPAGVTSAEIWGWGAGGAGGASSDGTGNPAGTAGCGGGSGAFFYARVSGQTPGTTTAVTIGTAGVGVANAATSGGNGTATSFGAFATANGGTGGQSGRNANIVGGVGGGASGGVLNINGGQGGTGGPASTFDAVMPLHIYNKGGMAPYAVGTLNWFGTGVAPNGFCSGGSGASGGSSVAGGNGGPGLMIVRW